MYADPIKAQAFAEIAHAGQYYSENLPYTYHLREVVSVLTRFGFTDPTIITAAWLHDTIEDTTRSYNDIKKAFGVDVAELVYAVTSELGRNRTERNDKTYPKLVAFGERAVTLKLADRIANLESGLAQPGGKSDMYRKEFAHFEEMLRPVCSDKCEPMWAHVRRLLGIISADVA